MAVARPSLTCPRCGGSMDAGYTINITNEVKSVPKWAAGEPVKSIWTGFKVKKAELKDVSTHRCRRCGFLESYA